MKKGRFLWSAHRITERQKAGKARSIKGKQLKNSRSTDLIINLEDVILAIQLKERNERVLSKQASETRNFGISIFI